MKEEKKVKLSTIIIIMVLVSIAFAATIIFKNRFTNDTNNMVQNATNDNTQIINPEVIVENEIIDKSDITMNFLKLENEKKNMIYSPLSIKYALSMLNEGADGNTKVQIEKLLGNATLTKYDNKDKVLSLANSIYIKDNYKKYVKEDYKNTLVQKYQAELQYDSFKNAKKMNKWIEQKTLGIVKEMIKDESVQDPYTKILLINALAIDMEWRSQFNQIDTCGDDFYLADNRTMQATTMSKKVYTDAVSYYKDKNVTALTMDLRQYDDIQLEFIAVMPNNNQLSEYVNKVTIKDIQKMVDKSTKASETKSGVRIKIPKFVYNYDLKLKEDLKKLGMTDVFDADLANLSKMVDTELKLYIGNALHKSDIQFTEKGIKAAAVTVLLVKDTMSIEGKDKPEEIVIDKPFLYVVRDKNTKEVWFVGTVYEPNSWEKDKAEYQK